MNDRIQNRITALRNRMAEQNLDAFLVLFEENRRYLSGFTGDDSQFDESAGVLLITADALILATDSRYDLQAKREAFLYDVICYRKGLAAELPDILRGLSVSRMGFESRRMSVSLFNKIRQTFDKDQLKVELAPVPDMVDHLRMIKDEDELAAIRTAVAVAETAFAGLLNTLVPGMSEAEAAWELEKNMRAAGAQRPSFPIIAAFGKNAALPHAIPGNDRLRPGEPLLFDWGARVNGYCSDMTRTLISGTSDPFDKIFTIVDDARKMAIDAIRPGIHSKQVDDIARGHIAEKGYGDYFGHGLGHGLGLAVHESPSIGPLAERDAELVENMVFTIEPGIYLPDWGGIRLESMVRVTADGAEVLNRLPITIDFSG
jgi:Xaa-Pro aminopeptidase